MNDKIYIEVPKYCPVCGGKTEIVKDNESEVLMCTNPNCSGKLLGRLKFFVSKPAMNIDGLSEATLQKFIELGWLSSFKDIFTLKDRFAEMVKLDGFGETSVNKLLDAIEKSRDVKLENFITALSIPNIGKSAAKTVSRACDGDFENFIHLYESNFDWTRLEDFGAIMAKNLEEYLNEYYSDVYNLALEMHFLKSECKQIEDNPLNGIKFCITGSFSQSRDKLKEQLESKGAKFVSSVSKNLDILFCGEKAGSKLTKAQSLGVKIAYEDELMKMLGE